MSNMVHALKATSSGRLWTGFDAAIYDTFGGVMEFSPSASHHVSMTVGPPVRATCRCDGRLHRRLQATGDIDVVPLGCSVRWEDEGPTTTLSIHLSPSLVRAAADGMGLNSDLVFIEPQLQLTDPHIQHICWAIAAELEEGEASHRLYADSLGTALAAHLLRRYAPIAPHRIKRGFSNRELRRVLDYIGDNLGQNLTLIELTQIAGVSASHFKSLFKESLGVPVHQYVVQRRVQAAVSLLLQGRAASDVALDLGFADQSHMARCMRRVLGMTPGDLRYLSAPASQDSKSKL
jgi:AraC family transcriptional regulator